MVYEICAKIWQNVGKIGEIGGFWGKCAIFSKKSAEKFAGKEKSRTFATRLRNNGSSLTSLRKDNEVKLEDEIKKSL